MRLKKIDLTKAVKHECPGIKLGKTSYLVKHGGQWFAGIFSRLWFGLSFFGWFGGPLQFDAPGTNCSEWEAVYEIIENRN